jgi:uncharacterized protein (TIGR00725 family)
LERLMREPFDRQPVIAVSGPGETATETDREHARALGVAIARSGWVLATGGRDLGVMDAASHGARDAGGLVIGILPGIDSLGASNALSVAIVTGLADARNNVLVLTGDVVVVCGMSPGTASELGLALRASKPLVLLAPSPETRAFVERIAAGRCITVDTVDDVVAAIGRLLQATRTHGPA